jgi:hypothetical protein
MVLITLSKKNVQGLSFFECQCVLSELRMLITFVFKQDIPIEKSSKIDCLLKLKPKHFQGTWVKHRNDILIGRTANTPSLKYSQRQYA